MSIAPDVLKKLEGEKEGPINIEGAETKVKLDVGEIISEDIKLCENVGKSVFQAPFTIKKHYDYVTGLAENLWKNRAKSLPGRLLGAKTPEEQQAEAQKQQMLSQKEILDLLKILAGTGI